MATEPLGVAKFKVRLELEVDVQPAWGRDHTLGQIADQAGLSALNSVTRGLEPMFQAGSVRLVSKPVVFAAMMPVGKRS